MILEQPATAHLIVEVAANEWLIHDTRYADGDSRRLVAFIETGTTVAGTTETDTVTSGVRVTWVQRTSLPTRFASIADVIEALRRWDAATDAPRNSRPVRIPSFPPRQN